MVKHTLINGLVVTCVLWLGNMAPARAAQYTVADMLSLKPSFDDVQITTPAPEEYASCEVKLIAGRLAPSHVNARLPPAPSYENVQQQTGLALDNC